MPNSLKTLLLVLVIVIVSCNESQKASSTETTSSDMSNVNLYLDLEQANRLAALPLKCIDTEYPNKTGVIVAKDEDIKSPKAYHPAFYGCFDWHSAVHGHWVLVNLLKNFPELEKAEVIRQKLGEHLTKENIEAEVAYFHMNDYSMSFERTYGWAWLLKLAEELKTWDDKDAQEWFTNLEPLSNLIVANYLSYLPKLTYPIRVGEHSNTAFGLTFAYDYAKAVEAEDLLALIEQRAKDFYTNDKGCPITWEPSGYDFLSPCLEEADIMRRVLPKEEFKNWFEVFLPDLVNNTSALEPAKVSDRSDGKLVHLDGLNFSRAWVLYGIVNEHPDLLHLKDIGDDYLAFSLPNIIDGDYAGEHWLASFALFALDQR